MGSLAECILHHCVKYFCSLPTIFPLESYPDSLFSQSFPFYYILKYSSQLLSFHEHFCLSVEHHAIASHYVITVVRSFDILSITLQHNIPELLRDSHDPPHFAKITLHNRRVHYFYAYHFNKGCSRQPETLSEVCLM